MRDMYAQRKDVCARRGQYTALPSWTAPCPHRRYRPTHIAVGTNLNSPAHMDASRETIGAAGGASTLPLAGERTGLHVQGRVTVQLTLPVVGERTTRRVQGRVAVQSVRSRPSGSEGMGSEHARGRVAVHLTLPLAGERTARRVQGRVAVQSVRSGPSGSEGMGSGHARGRVAVLLTLPLAGERTGQYISHCHSPVNVRAARSRPSGSADRALKEFDSAGRDDLWTCGHYVGVWKQPERSVPRT